MIGDESFDVMRLVRQRLDEGIKLTFNPRAAELLLRIRDAMHAEYLAGSNLEFRFVRRVPVRRFMRRDIPNDQFTVSPTEMDGWITGVPLEAFRSGDRTLWKIHEGAHGFNKDEFYRIQMTPDFLAHSESLGCLEPTECWQSVIQRLGFRHSAAYFRLDRPSPSPGPDIPTSSEFLLFEEPGLPLACKFHHHLAQIERLGKLGVLSRHFGPSTTLLNFGLFIAETLERELLFDLSCYFAPLHSRGRVVDSERRWGVEAELAWREGELDWPEGDYFVCLSGDARHCLIEILSYLLKCQCSENRLAVMLSGPGAGRRTGEETNPQAGPADEDYGSVARRERDILEVLKNQKKRLTVDRLLDALQKAKKTHGESTVRTHLPRMKREGKLTNCRRCRPPGYGLPGWPCPHAADSLTDSL